MHLNIYIIYLYFFFGLGINESFFVQLLEADA